MNPDKSELLSIAARLSEIVSELNALCGTGDNPAPEEAPPKPPAAKALTFDDVRAVFAAKACEGLTDRLKALIGKYGASKLSDVSESDYAALLKEAEAIV
jgi:hypothetical protein